ncbi:hypothetical protein ADIS_3827 [Lunatimonas lonarensis]|uniref:Uncharacterized protein n=1 Tax=Lunatimonas lonarensis TaxID=1232681 RepID=R7ZNM3_9BACT|nr:hypothetical protein ADIS_3827 [Lunatimonas lonarensis]
MGGKTKAFPPQLVYFLRAVPLSQSFYILKGDLPYTAHE